MSDKSAAHQLAKFCADHPRLAVVTGAGCSTDSGIGDYRDAEGNWKHSQPIQYADFMAGGVSGLAARQRYWARSILGWPQFDSAAPNASHDALARLESLGLLTGLITQNVDGLHQRAGHRQVLDLHGRLDRVVCQRCAGSVARAELQTWLLGANESLLPDLRAELARANDAGRHAPDGDAPVTRIAQSFVVPDCADCGGILKPDVVFYGESVPKPWVEQAYRWVEDADALLVVGSSLMVFSSFRFCRAATQAGIPIAIINRGVTRADDMAALKLDVPCADALVALPELLT